MTSFLGEKQRDPKVFENWYYRRDPSHVFFYSKETMEYIAKEIFKMKCIFPEGKFLEILLYKDLYYNFFRNKFFTK